MYYPLYYSRSPNFGDAINPILYKHITSRECTFADISPKITACGSILHAANPLDFVWGTGCISSEIPLKCGVTTHGLAVRGPLTSEILYKYTKKHCEIYGDPGLLLSKYFDASEKTDEYGIVPNYIDREFLASHPHFIDIMWDVEKVIKSVTKCDFIITSALHGIICSESFGIPAVWVEISDNVAGQGFKFRDYYLGTGRKPPTPLNWRSKHDVSEAKAIAKDWEPPKFDADLLLSVCPFDWRKTDYQRWEKVDSHWDERNEAISRIVNEDANVIEFGCGNMYLKKKVRNYTPSDIYRRADNCLVCDLNTGIFPDLSRFDTIVMSGVIEYIYPEYIEKFLKHAKDIKTFICSYSHEANREFNGFVNDYTKGELINLFSDNGFILERDYGGIYKFTCA